MKRTFAVTVLLLSAALAAVPLLALAGTEVTNEQPGTVDLYRGTSKVSSWATLADCEAAAVATDEVRTGWGCRSIFKFDTVEVTPPPPPPPPPAATATLSVSPTSLPAGGGTITITYSCSAGTATLTGLGQTYPTGNASGTVSGQITQSATIGLTCSGGGGASQSVNVAAAPDPTPTPDPQPDPVPAAAGFYTDVTHAPAGYPLTVCGGSGQVTIGGAIAPVLEANASRRPGISCQRVQASAGEIAVGGVDTGLTFTVQQGDILFVSQAGNDSTAAKNDPSKPWRHLQGSSAGSGALGAAKPGDVLMLRGGTWTDKGFEGNFARVWNEAGTAPTGTKGSGYITLTCYPGETCDIKGSIMGAGSAKRGVSGCYFAITGLRVTGGSASDSAPINAQYASCHWRIVNNELTWPNAPSNAKAGGFTSNSSDVAFLGNYIHDIAGPYENHGTYLAEGANRTEFGFNMVSGVALGNLFQTFNGLNSNCIDGIKLHDNLLQDGGRYGLNIASGTCGVDAWNNTVRRSAFAGLRFDIPNWYPVNLSVRDSTFENVNTKGSPSSQAMLNCDGQLTNGTAIVQNNTFTAGRSGVHGYDSTGAGCPNLKLIGNAGL